MGDTHILQTHEKDLSASASDNDDTSIDPWALPELTDDATLWKDLGFCGKTKRILWHYIGKTTLLIGLLYLFIVSIDLLHYAFKPLGGKAAGQIFQENELLRNPVCGLMIGVLVTVLIQSSSTSTSIVITMTASDILQIDQAVYIVMGANIGTSITNTIVSLGQVGNRKDFRRAFAGATVHDMFNWLSVVVLLPLEAASGFLRRITSTVVKSFNISTNKEAKKDILRVITKPLTSLIIQLDSKVIQDIATDMNKTKEHGSMIKRYCIKETRIINTALNGTVIIPAERCKSVFSYLSENFSDEAIGAALLVLALLMLVLCLLLMVKLLHSLLKGTIAKVVRKAVNADFPGVLRHLTGYVAIIMGALITMVVQSSSIFTSTLTPLVGVGVISIERMLPLTLGANLGTTSTGVLASLANSGDGLEKALQVALCHLFFNLFGILIWYPIPYLRRAPIGLAKMLGTTTGKYRWFAIVYIIFIFLIVPSSVFALSIAGWYVLLAVGGPVLLLILLIVTINLVQYTNPQYLPKFLKNWEFLPLWMRSLEPYDKVMSRVCFCKRCGDIQSSSAMHTKENGIASLPDQDKPDVIVHGNGLCLGKGNHESGKRPHVGGNDNNAFVQTKL